MASKIEWTDETWNPVVGCQVVSPGCTNCYAMKMAGRLEAMGVPHYQGTTRKTKAGFVWTGKMSAAPAHILYQPLHWRRPRKIFVNSMSDLFAEGVPVELIDQVWAVMAASPWHIYQILTKRPEAMRDYVQGLFTPEGLQRLLFTWVEHPTGRKQLIELVGVEVLTEPLPNVWLGVSVEDQPRALRLVDLLATPAALHWASLEPLLGALNLRNVTNATDSSSQLALDALTGHWWRPAADGVGSNGDLGQGLARLRLVVVGGESGRDPRPMHEAWVRTIERQCAAAGTDFFFKQWGGWVPAPWKLNRETGEDDQAYKARSDATGATHGLDRDGRLTRMQHRPWSAERAPVAPSSHVGVRLERKKAAGRLLDGVEHNAMPEVAHG